MVLLVYEMQTVSDFSLTIFGTAFCFWRPLILIHNVTCSLSPSLVVATPIIYVHGLKSTTPVQFLAAIVVANSMVSKKLHVLVYRNC